MTTTFRQFRVIPAARPGKDPGPAYLAGFLDGLRHLGLKVPVAATEAAAEAVTLTAEATGIRADLTISKPERVHQWEQLRRRAGAARVGALAALDGPRIEAAARKIVDPAIDRIAVALAAIPDDVGDAHQAMLAGNPVTEAWSQVVRDNDLTRRVWNLLDLGRRLGGIPVELAGRQASPTRLGSVLQSVIGSTGAGFVAEAHRFARPGVVHASVSASKAIVLGAGPGVFSAEDALAALVAYADEWLTGRAPTADD